MPPRGSITPRKVLGVPVLALGLIAATQDRWPHIEPGELRWERTGAGYTVSAGDGNHVRLRDLLDLASDALDLPIFFRPQVIADAYVPLDGATFVPRDEAASFVEGAMGPKGFFFVLRAAGTARFAELLRPIPSKRPPSHLAEALPVREDDLDSWRHRQVLLRVVVPLEHVDAMHAFATLAPLVDLHIGALLMLSDTNGLLIVERADAICRAVDLMRQLDVPATDHPRTPSMDRELSALEDRVAALEGR